MFIYINVVDLHRLIKPLMIEIVSEQSRGLPVPDLIASIPAATGSLVHLSRNKLAPLLNDVALLDSASFFLLGSTTT